MTQRYLRADRVKEFTGDVDGSDFIQSPEGSEAFALSMNPYTHTHRESHIKLPSNAIIARESISCCGPDPKPRGSADGRPPPGIPGGNMKEENHTAENCHERVQDERHSLVPDDVLQLFLQAPVAVLHKQQLSGSTRGGVIHVSQGFRSFTDTPQSLPWCEAFGGPCGPGGCRSPGFGPRPSHPAG